MEGWLSIGGKNFTQYSNLGRARIEVETLWLESRNLTTAPTTDAEVSNLLFADLSTFHRSSPKPKTLPLYHTKASPLSCTTPTKFHGYHLNLLHHASTLLFVPALRAGGLSFITWSLESFSMDCSLTFATLYFPQLMIKETGTSWTDCTVRHLSTSLVIQATFEPPCRSSVQYSQLLSVQLHELLVATSTLVITQTISSLP